MESLSANFAIKNLIGNLPKIQPERVALQPPQIPRPDNNPIPSTRSQSGFKPPKRIATA